MALPAALESSGSDAHLWELCQAANELGIKLEMVGGRPTWEFFANTRHQIAVRDILRSLGQPSRDGGCDCEVIPDAYIRFPDGSLKRPDLAIYCQPPEPSDQASTAIPEAVVEVISAGYEAKDYEAAPFYLLQGVLDVVIHDPRTRSVVHITRNSTERALSPITLTLQTGCTVTIP